MAGPWSGRRAALAFCEPGAPQGRPGGFQTQTSYPIRTSKPALRLLNRAEAERAFPRPPGRSPLGALPCVRRRWELRRRGGALRETEELLKGRVKLQFPLASVRSYAYWGGFSRTTGGCFQATTTTNFSGGVVAEGGPRCDGGLRPTPPPGRRRRGSTFSHPWDPCGQGKAPPAPPLVAFVDFSLCLLSS